MHWHRLVQLSQTSIKGKLKHFLRNLSQEQTSIAFWLVNSVIALNLGKSQRKLHLSWKICAVIIAGHALSLSSTFNLSKASWHHRWHPQVSLLASKGYRTLLITFARLSPFFRSALLGVPQPPERGYAEILINDYDAPTNKINRKLLLDSGSHWMGLLMAHELGSGVCG